jgi:RNA polymerase sigma factor (SigZ family)
MPISTEEAWLALQAPLRLFLRRHVADEESVADLLQEIFLRVHMHSDELHSREKLESWIYQIARHLVSDYYRRRRALLPLEAAQSIQSIQSIQSMAATIEEVPDEEARSAIRDAVVAMLDCLPPADREVLLLTDYGGLSQRELARRLGLSFSGAKSRVQRARARLRRLLLACCHFEFDRLGRVIDYQPRCPCCCCRSQTAASFSPSPRPLSMSIAIARAARPRHPVTQGGSNIMSNDVPDEEQLRTAVQEYYGALAQHGSGACCCGGCDTADGEQEGGGCCDCYSAEELAVLPEGVRTASACCGNPLTIAGLQPGERVLDLGSGAGRDAFLAALRVGPTGLVYGLDMNAAMLTRAEEGRQALGLSNVRLLQAPMEAVPLPAESVEVVISNCAINLAPDKDRVLCEAHRLLVGGGRLALADIVVSDALPLWLRSEPRAWVLCLAGALTVERYRQLLTAVGFQEIHIEISGRCELAGVKEIVSLAQGAPERQAGLTGWMASALIRARKPGAVHP